MRANLVAHGYNADDTNVLLALTLLKAAKQAEAQAVAQFNWEKKAAAAKAKNQPEPPKPAILSI